MNTVLIRTLEVAAAILKSIQGKEWPQIAEAIDEIDQALQLLRSYPASPSLTISSKHRFVATDRFNNTRYLTVQGSNIRLWNTHGQAESLSSIAHDNTQRLIFALEDAASEAEMLAAMNRLSYQAWSVFTPER